METVKMGENIFMGIRQWMKLNKVDGIWFDDSVGDDYIKVTLVKKEHAISRMIHVRDFYTRYPYYYIECLAKELNEEVNKEASK